MPRFFVLLMFLFVVGCSGSGGSSPTPNGTTTTTTTTTTTPSTTCVAAHGPLVDASGSHAVAWTKTYCGPSGQGEEVYIDSVSTDDSGQVFGATRDVNRGRVTWDFTNLDYTDLKWPNNGNDIVFMALKRVQANQEAEWNWHMLGNRFGDSGPIETRLVSQRPNDDYCVPDWIRFCEKKYSDENPYIYERNKKYRWDCYWNTTTDSGLSAGTYGAYPGLKDGVISCDLYDITTTTRKLTTYYMATSGPYPRLASDWQFFFVSGGSAIAHFRPDGNDVVPMIMSNFRFSIMN